MSRSEIPLRTLRQTQAGSATTLTETTIKGEADIELPVHIKDGSVAHTHVIPDGGLRAWCSVAGSFLFILCSFGWANAFGVFQTYYIEALLPNYSPSSISWIGSVQLFLLFGLGLFSGKFFDAHRVRVALIAGSVLLVGCIFALSAVNENQYYAVRAFLPVSSPHFLIVIPEIFLSQGIGQGLGQGLIYLPALALNAHHFQKKRAIAMGITICGSSIGGIIFPSSSSLCLLLSRNLTQNPHSPLEQRLPNVWLPLSSPSLRLCYPRLPRCRQYACINQLRPEP